MIVREYLKYDYVTYCTSSRTLFYHKYLVNNSILSRIGNCW